MLTKAYISEIINTHSIRVRMPLYNKIEGVNGATPKTELAIACVCSLPNFVTDPQVGDIVIVGFEENDTSKPVILGYLSKSTELPSITDIKCNKLTALDDVTLPAHTNIGNVTHENLKCLLNLKDNIKLSLQQTNASILSMNEELSKVSESVSGYDKSLETTNSTVSGLNTSISALTSRLSKVEKYLGSLFNSWDETDSTNLTSELNNTLKKSAIILDEKSYGDNVSEVTSPKEGQIYFTIKDEY